MVDKSHRHEGIAGALQSRRDPADRMAFGERRRRRPRGCGQAVIQCEHKLRYLRQKRRHGPERGGFIQPAVHDCVSQVEEFLHRALLVRLALLPGLRRELIHLGEQLLH